MDQVLTIGKATKVTKTVHGAPYDAISVSNPKNTQAGKTIFITGGGTAIGKAVGVAFARASAKTIIIVGRRADVLKQGAEHIEKEAKAAGTSTKVIHRALDITSHSAVDELFRNLADDGITIDVFVSNAAAFTEPKPMLELGAEEVLRQMDTNVAAPIYLLSKFHAQGKGSQQFVVNVSSNVSHWHAHPITLARPSYSFTKNASTMFFQMIAETTPVEKMQVVSYHPGLIWSEIWETMGFMDDTGFDDIDMQGSFAVWLATPAAAFLHGRFAWASWDVTELATGEVRKRIDEDPYFLRVTIEGAGAVQA